METTERLQFIVELDKLRETPCSRYREYFVDGKADALELFRLEGEQYSWLYKYSDYDIIGFQIQHNIFNWEKDSWAVARFRPQYFDSQKYNWEDYSWAVAEFCPQHFDPEKYNWERDGWKVAQCCPQHFDTEKYNWKEHSFAVAEFCQQYFDPEKYNWKIHSWYVEKFCPHLLHLKP